MIELRRVGTWAMKRALFHSGLLSLAGLARRRAGGLVLRYHAISDGAAEVPYATPDICLPVEVFRLQMAFVKRAYTVLALDELVERVGRGATLPPRALAITFDDGYADNHRLALPVLGELGLPATLYLATGSLEGGPPLWMSAVRALVLGARAPALAVPGLPPIVLGPPGRRGPEARALTRALVPLPPDERAARLAAAAAAAGVDPGRLLAGVMLDWAQVRELAAAGWTIGAHTVTHLNVALAAPAEAEAEIAASRDAIAAAIGRPVRHFAYPNSGGAHRYFDGSVAGMLGRLGFRSAVTSRPGVVGPWTDPFAVPRIGVSPRLAAVSDLAATLVRQRLAS
jgi:peptidoglycan/xylan/chitin deacetylase (PgdA/CDA1 family)